MLCHVVSCCVMLVILCFLNSMLINKFCAAASLLARWSCRAVPAQSPRIGCASSFQTQQRHRAWPWHPRSAAWGSKWIPSCVFWFPSFPAEPSWLCSLGWHLQSRVTLTAVPRPAWSCLWRFGSTPAAPPPLAAYSCSNCFSRRPARATGNPNFAKRKPWR